MVKLFIDLLDFLRGCAPLLTSLFILTMLFILLAKSIKKHSTIYYTLFAVPFVLVAIPAVSRMFGIETFSFNRIPFLGEILRDYIHMGTFGHPLLIIIMYVGALSPKISGVGKLMSIRKELSIISGFPVLTHSLIRVTNNFPNGLKFFTNNAEYMANTNVVSEVGAGITSFSYVFGIVMLIIFIPLWVTSFDWVRKQMTHTKWKKVQKWAYVLYATLFIHAMCIQIGGMLNPRGGNASRQQVTVTATTEQARGERSETARPADGEKRNGHGSETTRQATGSGQGSQQVARPQSGGRAPVFGFSNIEVSAQTKRYVHITSLILIFGSYLFLRLRKAKKDAARKARLK